MTQLSWFYLLHSMCKDGLPEHLCAQAMEAAAAVADAVARQWLGVLVYPGQPKDAWLVEGLAMRLREAFLRRCLGKNEATHRCACALLTCGHAFTVSRQGMASQLVRAICVKANLTPPCLAHSTNKCKLQLDLG